MIPYTHKTFSRSRSLRLSIGKDGQVVVTSPPRVPKRAIEQFVLDHEEWIQANLSKIQAVKTQLKKNADEVLLFGKGYDVKTSLEGKTIGVKIKGNSLIVTPVSQGKLSTQQALNRFLKSTASLYITKRVSQLGSEMHTTFNALSFKTQKTRWGSCSSQGNLNFNWRLIHAPREVIDYVIIHELAHRTHMNHGQGFWKLVAKFDPEFRQHRGWLKRNGMGLE